MLNHDEAVRVVDLPIGTVFMVSSPAIQYKLKSIGGTKKAKEALCEYIVNEIQPRLIGQETFFPQSSMCWKVQP